MDRKPMTLLMMFMEWCIAMSWLAGISILSVSTKDTIGFVLIGLMMLCLIGIIYATEQGRLFSLVFVIVVTMSMVFLMKQSITIVVTPIVGLLFRHRLTRIREEHNLHQVARTAFMVEMVAVPVLLVFLDLRGQFMTWLHNVLLWAWTQTIPTVNWAIPSSLIIISAIVYVLFRMLTLVMYQDFDKDVPFQWISLVPVVGGFGSIAAISYGIVQLWKMSQVTTRVTAIKGPIHRGILPPKKTTVKHVEQAFLIPWWAWALFFVFVVGVVISLWLYLRKRRNQNHSVIVQELRTQWRQLVSTPPAFLETSSFVRKTYQRLLLLMYKVGHAAKPSETSREYLARIVHEMDPGDAEVTPSVERFEHVYRSVRYSGDSEETSDIQQTAQEGFDMISARMNPNGR